MATLQIVVYGLPAPQGSKRHLGKGVLVESSKRVKPWREDVKAAANRARFNLEHSTFALADWPLVVDMVFSFRRPKSHYRTGRNAHLVKDSAPARPASAPDLSKLARSTEDALTDSGVWRDDSRVVEYGRLAKVWIGEDRDALDVPGALIRIRELDQSGPNLDVYIIGGRNYLAETVNVGRGVL